MTRLAVVDNDKLKNMQQKTHIQSICPVNRAGKECIKLDENKKLIIDELLCTGCGICPKEAPNAIKIINLPERLNKNLVFKYGKNKFELFRLPIPQENKVIGLLGMNGIGKTTALEILSGLLRPNLGKFNKKINNENILKFFRGSELQTYFQKLFKKEIAVSYKPQYIDKIPIRFNGTVLELLEKLSPDKEIIKLSEKLKIKRILDRNLNNLSGGELQKVAIAATILKTANVYFFDEPSSYLDIKERVRIAKIIREISSDNSVVAVEHDLIILDYLADIIYILFGETSAYGVISQPLSAKNGINNYLDGYIRSENIRFRSQGIKFEHHLAEKKEDTAFLTQWNQLYKRLGDFELNVEPSEISFKEIIGIVGANATGKTTFMKILTGELKTDIGKIDKKLKISYKPQYIEPGVGKVIDVLSNINKEIYKHKTKVEILKPLEINYILDYDIEDLSGGELQRVAIAACLLREADLYLFDEPSTYLDIEQRIQVARAIQKIVKNREASSLIIDHDLLFINYISDKLMVFDGKPSINGKAHKITEVKKGMNYFLKDIGITLRKDSESGRPRVNKLGSQKDHEQKQSGKYYI